MRSFLKLVSRLVHMLIPNLDHRAVGVPLPNVLNSLGQVGPYFSGLLDFTRSVQFTQPLKDSLAISLQIGDRLVCLFLSHIFDSQSEAKGGGE